MPISEQLRLKLRPVAEKMEELKRVELGGVKFDGGGFSNLLFLLLHYVDLPPDIPEISRYQICREAAIEVGGREVITADGLYEEIAVRYSKVKARSVNQYVVVSNLSVPVPEEFRSRAVDGWEISIQLGEPRGFDRTFLQGTHVRRWKPYATDSPWLLVRGSARTPEEAIDSAMRAIDLHRGLWNLGQGAGTAWSLDIGGSHRPTNTILVGPVHTVHLPGGEPASRFWGFDPSYCPEHDRWYRTSPEGWESAAVFEEQLAQALPGVSMRQFVTDAIVRYCRALDDVDPEATFVLLWGVLEHLTGANAAGKSDRLIERASNIYSEHAHLDLITLRMLLDQRNASVHRGASSQFRRTGIAMLLNLISDFLATLLRVHPQFKSPMQFWDFLDLPAGREGLDEQVSLRLLAKDLRGYDMKDPPAGGS